MEGCLVEPRSFLGLRRRIAYAVYGRMGPRTMRIGPKTVLKCGFDIDLAEANTMKFIGENTSIPVPKVLSAWKRGDVIYITMQYVPGERAWSAWDKLRVDQQDDLCRELESYVKQLRQLTPPSPYIVSSVDGGPCRDHRFGLRTIGPFNSHDAFHERLRRGDNLDKCAPEVATLHNGRYVSKFTHGDLTMFNVLVHEGKISAILDWECAGWRPEYWEYTRAHYRPEGVPPGWFDAIRRATGDYDIHLAGERELWRTHEFPSTPLTR